MARVNLFRPQIELTSRRAGSDLVRHTVNQVRSGAVALIPIGDHRSGSGAPARDITLMSSLYSSVDSNSATVKGRVGAKTKHALTVHQGSRAHVIRSRSGKVLKFRWDRGDFLVAARAGRRRGSRRTGQFHYFLKVRHPGNKNPVRYLTTPLHLFGRINGFRVTTVAPGVASRLP